MSGAAVPLDTQAARSMGGRWLHSGLDRLRGAECMHGFLEIEHVHQETGRL